RSATVEGRFAGSVSLAVPVLSAAARAAGAAGLVMEYGNAGSVATLPDCRSERHAYRDAVIHADDIDDEWLIQLSKTAKGATENRLVSFCFACIKIIGAEVNQHVVGGTPC